MGLHELFSTHHRFDGGKYMGGFLADRSTLEGDSLNVLRIADEALISPKKNFEIRLTAIDVFREHSRITPLRFISS